jgi:hypothetical protein
MNHSYEIIPSLAKNLTKIAKMQEEAIKADQSMLTMQGLREHIKDLTEEELEYFQNSLLDIYDAKEGKDEFFEFLLHLVKQHLESRGGK